MEVTHIYTLIERCHQPKLRARRFKSKVIIILFVPQYVQMSHMRLSNIIDRCCLKYNTVPTTSHHTLHQLDSTLRYRYNYTYTDLVYYILYKFIHNVLKTHSLTHSHKHMYIAKYAKQLEGFNNNYKQIK